MTLPISNTAPFFNYSKEIPNDIIRKIFMKLLVPNVLSLVYPILLIVSKRWHTLKNDSFLNSHIRNILINLNLIPNRPEFLEFNGLNLLKTAFFCRYEVYLDTSESMQSYSCRHLNCIAKQKTKELINSCASFIYLKDSMLYSFNETCNTTPFSFLKNVTCAHGTDLSFLVERLDIYLESTSHKHQTTLFVISDFDFTNADLLLEKVKSLKNVVDTYFNFSLFFVKINTALAAKARVIEFEKALNQTVMDNKINYVHLLSASQEIEQNYEPIVKKRKK